MALRISTLVRNMGIPLLRGRVFTETDADKSPSVVIINEALARKYWPKGDPLGRQMTIGKGVGPEFTDATREIVGVVGNVREAGLDNDPPPVMYIPQAQVTDGFTALAGKVLPTAWVLRTSMDPLLLANIVRREAIAVDPQQAVFDFRPMEQVLQKSVTRRGFVLLLLTIFAGVALLLAAIGIYGHVLRRRTANTRDRHPRRAGSGPS